ncbi:uncharacterized protein K444DRAFT_128948 [Hyaloscypha bicolor E]|uniref:Uncharacterized protein n=1 Tax=Hyaloscypha bicolor E TaxID=1095630 RepID=A0A2J6SUF5_9HELO|nr:uncharacterized protein K444DRAFT_128948 [Hyaloscypha bicolor E]PMD54400.1 hypothetical protein K444DRAFT_128948 [Hyaloscypha bicolor E]
MPNLNISSLKSSQFCQCLTRCWKPVNPLYWPNLLGPIGLFHASFFLKLFLSKSYFRTPKSRCSMGSLYYKTSIDRHLSEKFCIEAEARCRCMLTTVSQRLKYEILSVSKFTGTGF